MISCKERDSIKGLKCGAFQYLWIYERKGTSKEDWEEGYKGKWTISFIFCILMLWHLGPPWPWRDCPSRVNKFLEIVNSYTSSALFKYKPIQNSLPNHILCSPHTSGHYLLALITPGPGSRTQGIALVPQSPLKLFKLASPKPFSPASPFPCCGNYKEGSCPQFFPLPLPPDRPWSFPLWPPMTWCPPSSC